MAVIRLTHVDGKLPNMALMKLAHWHQHALGDEVVLARSTSPSMFEPFHYDACMAPPSSSGLRTGSRH